LQQVLHAKNISEAVRKPCCIENKVTINKQNSKECHCMAALLVQAA